MNRYRQLARRLSALGMIGTGVLMIATGTLVVFVQLAGLGEGSPLQSATAKHGLRAAQILRGPSLVTDGLSHSF